MKVLEGHPTDEQRHKDSMEGVKLFYDLFKHLTTLSTGALLLLGTLLEKFIKAPILPGLITATFAGFLVTVLFSVVSMFVLANSLQESGELPDDGFLNLGALGLIGAVGGFLIGLICLSVFTVKNI